MAAKGIRGKPCTAYYVLLMLTLCYVVNVVDRSQVLAASVQAIKKEFGATDFQLGMLSGIPFALFYSLMGIPIAAWPTGPAAATCWSLAVATWSGMTALCGTAVNFTMLFCRARRHRHRRGRRQPAVALAHLRLLSRERRGTAFCHLRAGRAGRHLARRGDWRVGQSESGMAQHVHRGRPARDRAGAHRAPHGEGAAAGNVRRAAGRGSRQKTPRAWSRSCVFLWLRPSFRHLSLAARCIRSCGTRAARSTTRFCSARTG